MASTYSPALRLELMATGDQSGTWGDTTNTNLGTLLEQAITGFLSVAQGDVANLTLTALDGATDQSRNAVVDLTGALTAARNVVVPTSEKVYLIKNSTTGGFSIVAKTTAGSGVTIPPGTSRWVYCDGTNVVDGLTGNQAANAFLAGYTTTATAAGTTVLTVASTQTQYFTGVTTQTITLPVTSTLVLGQEYEIVNLSTGSLTVNSSGGNLVATVLAGNTLRVQVILTSGTSAASWNAIAASVPNPLTLSGSTVGYTPLVLTSTQADAAAGPILNLYRDSATPAANDILAQLLWSGEDSAGNTQEYASIEALIVSPTSTTETGALDIYTTISGARTRTMSVGPNNPNTPTQFIDGYATTATAAGTTTLTVASAKNQYFTGTTTQTVVLPVTSTLVLGQTFEIFNISTGKVTVQSSGANTIQVMGGTGITYAPGAPGTKLVVTCIATSGTGTSSWAYEYVTPITNLVKYTPTGQGFGTLASDSVWSRRDGDCLVLEGYFTTGTVDGNEARLNLGYNGTNANLTSDATKIAALQSSGIVMVNFAGANNFYALMEGGVGYITFGVQGGAFAGLSKVAGSTFGTGTVISINARIPISGW
jgi:hypothetical protein